MHIPEITEKLVFGPDVGFNLCKAAGACITGLQSADFGKIKDLIKTTEFQAWWSPPVSFEGITGRIIDSPEEGIVGKDARELNPTLWTTSLGEEHYKGHVWRLYFWALLYDILEQAKIPDGKHVEVFVSFGLPHIHMGYKVPLQEYLVQKSPHKLSREGNKTWFITINETVDVQAQPFWICVDQIFTWAKEGLEKHIELLDGGLVAIDFGSKTTNSIRMVNNLVAVAHLSVSLGTWDVVREYIAPRVEELRQKAGITVGDVRWQALMQVYEDGELRIGKHEPISIKKELAEYNASKVAQRLQENDAKLLDGGANTRTIIMAGGDVKANFSAFMDAYDQNISGDCRIATDDDGNEEPLYRQMHGCLKGAVRTWLASMASTM